MEDVIFRVEDGKLILKLPTKNKGKFRWKTRDDNSQFGEGFATTTIPFTERAYMEWQIGYDSDVNHRTKTTFLDEMEFVGANGRSKNPYELSEILYLLMENGIITKEEIVELTKDIKKRDYSFDDEYRIENSESKKFTIEGFNFKRQDTVLPTFSYYKSPRGLSIEISIQKQQYASGVQPMVYFSIPIENFENKNSIIGRTSREVEYAKLVLDETNKEVILKMFVFFGMCSDRHKHDVVSILNLINEYQNG